MKKLLIISLFFFTIIMTTMSAMSTVVGWRTDGTGNYDKVAPVINWSTEENILWKQKLPSWSNASPVITGRRIFVNSEPTTLICVNILNGRILWQRSNSYRDVLSSEDYRKLTKELQRVPQKHDANGFSSAVPVTDGKRIFVVYGTGVVVCYDMNGTLKWGRLLQKPNRGWGHSASPSLRGDVLIVHIVDLFALDAQNGEIIWQAPSKAGWGSPIITEVERVPVVITSRQGDLFRLNDGTKLATGVSSLEYATPILYDDVIFSIERGASAYKLSTNSIGKFKPILLWQKRIKGSRHYASSLLYDGLIYAVSREARLSVIDSASGELIYEKKLGINGQNVNSVYPSLCQAGGIIFIGCEEGTTLALKPGRKYEELARNTLEKFRSTPVFVEDRMYLRGLDHLYCIGKL